MNRTTLIAISVFCAILAPPADAAPKSSLARQSTLKPTSEFTSTNLQKSKCLVAGEGRASYLCAGLGGYQVELEIFAARSGINLRYQGKTVYLLDQTFEACPGENPEKSNDVVQWRGYRNGGQFVPYAVIYRLSSSKPQSSKSRFNTLVVIQLDGENSRVVGQADGSRSDGNTVAEALADQLCAPGGRSGGGLPPVEDPGAGGAPEPGPRSGQALVQRSSTGSLLTLPNGQKFQLESTRGVLGPSSDPGSQEPFVGPGGWLVGLNEAPATKTSFTRLYLKDRSGRFSEIRGAHNKVFSMVGSGDEPKDPGFVRIEGIGTAWEGKVRVTVQVRGAKTGALVEDSVVVGRTGVIESRFRGE
jgi:hypothetical protein